ncbi:hypothetical protein cypCar_00026423 [Cyprinus carpio]|nr:hypothetical protein cypCar_00026423 [Cyprinus carpio]
MSPTNQLICLGHRVDWSRTEIQCSLSESSHGRFGAGHVYYVRDWRLDLFIMAGPLAFVVVYICQTATGLGSTAARATSMLSAVVNLLEIYHCTIPALVFGSLALVSGIMDFLLLETRRTELPGYTEEAEGKSSYMS